MENPEPLDLYRAAIKVLLDDLPEEQWDHATTFLLDDLERLYISAVRWVPPWINLLRELGRRRRS